MKHRRVYWLQLIIMLILVSGGMWASCKPNESSGSKSVAADVEQLTYGEDVCALTGDVIETVRYGGRMTLQDGKTLNFMSVECLAGYYLQMREPENASRMQVVDFTHGTRLMDVRKMVYLNSRLRPSPNGLSLTAIEAADTKMRSYIYDAYPGPMLEWDEVLDLVGEKWNLQAAGVSTMDEEGTAGKKWITGGVQ